MSNVYSWDPLKLVSPVIFFPFYQEFCAFLQPCDTYSLIKAGLRCISFLRRKNFVRFFAKRKCSKRRKDSGRESPLPVSLQESKFSYSLRRTFHTLAGKKEEIKVEEEKIGSFSRTCCYTRESVPDLRKREFVCVGARASISPLFIICNGH